MIKRVLKKYINYILIIITGSMLIMSIASNVITVNTVAEEGQLTQNNSEGEETEGNVSISGDGEAGAGGAGTDGAGGEGAGGEGAGAEGLGTDGAGTDGAGADGAGTDGTGTDGAGTDGTGTDGAGTDGAGTDGAGADGAGTDGAGADGGGTDGAGAGGSGSSEDTNKEDEKGETANNGGDNTGDGNDEDDGEAVNGSEEEGITVGDEEKVEDSTLNEGQEEETTEEEQENQCICTTHCTEDAVNEECPVCAENYEDCAPASTEEEEEELECTCTALCTAENFDEECPVCSKNFTECKFEEEDECTCEHKCEEGDVDLSCPVCAEDFTLCEGDELDYAAIIQYSISGEAKKVKYLTLGEALNGAKAVAEEVHADGDSNFVPVIEIKDELSISSTIYVENNCTFIIDFKGHKISLSEGAYLDLGSSDVTFKDTNAASINYGGDNSRPGGISGTSGRLLSGSGRLAFASGYYGISSGTLLTGFSEVTVYDAYLINSSGTLFDNEARFVVNNGFFVYDNIYGGEHEGSIVTPTSTVVAEMSLLIDGYSVRGYGLTTAVFKVTLQLITNTDYYYSTFAEAFEAAESLSKSNDGAKAIITINDQIVTNVAVSRTYNLTANPGGYAPVVQIDNINFTRGGADAAAFDGSMFVVSGGELILNDCSINGYISESQVAVSSMITVESGATLTLVGSVETGTSLTGNVALLGATAGDPAAGLYLKSGSILKVSGYITINNNVSYIETANQNGGIDADRLNRNLYMDVNSQIVVAGTLLRTESFLIGVTMSSADIDENEPVGSLATDYYNSLVAAGINIMDLSSFYMDSSAAYSMEYDFETNIITWSRSGALLPEAGAFRWEYIFLFIGLVGFIFRAIQASNEARKEIVRYITIISSISLAIGTCFGAYHVYNDQQLIRRNNQVVANITGSMDSEQYRVEGVAFEEPEVVEETVTSVEDISTEKIVEEVAPKKSIVPLDGREYIGIVEIESLGIKLPVLSSYTDADMKTTPCVYYGSRENDNLVIVGHNYDSQFGNFNLLDSKEVITAKLTLVDGSEYVYTSKLLEKLNPNQIDEMLTGDWDLTLFTCNYSGEKRIAIRFDLAR